jgi:hypothetical protein
LLIHESQFKAAKYLRLAEESGGPTVGNSWYVSSHLVSFQMMMSLANRVDRIWKEKYNPK